MNWKTLMDKASVWVNLVMPIGDIVRAIEEASNVRVIRYETNALRAKITFEAIEDEIPLQEDTDTSGDCDCWEGYQ